MYVFSLLVIHIKIDSHPGRYKRPGYFYKYASGVVLPTFALQIVQCNLILADAV